MENYDWGLHADAEEFLARHVDSFVKNCLAAKNISARMQNQTSTHLFDWIDHIKIPEASHMEKMGFKHAGSVDGMDIFKNEKSVLFPVLVGGRGHELAIKPENMDDFSRKIKVSIEGQRFASMRKGTISDKNGYVFSAVERRGSSGFVVKEDKDIAQYRRALEIFNARRRNFQTDKSGMNFTEKLIRKELKKLKPERVADAFFRNERSYWQKRNRAGQVQKKRQDRLGLGWGNHDHHTYRSSRENFRELIKIFEIMGYKCREQFYAGEGAGWGAQVLEHPKCEIVIFADVDITHEEKNTDIAHRSLRPSKMLGTVGLWIGLHGESILQAGMHHLEARFDFEKLRDDLQASKINVMKPFSYFDFLKQAFTEGQIWKVDRKRADLLMKRKLITPDQRQKFITQGAIGSHMENLQRRQGYKGFNQDSVTAIINATDPRKQEHKDYHRHRGA